MRVSVVFMNTRSRKLWTSSYRTKSTALRAVKGICSKTSNMVKLRSGDWSKKANLRQLATLPSKGFKYKKELKAHNKLKNKF